jgi:hypothetical protein
MQNSGQLHDQGYIMATVQLNGGTAQLEVNNGIGYTAIPFDEDGVHTLYLKPCEYRVVTTGGALVGLS